jgi:hypothetical protein
MDARVKPAHDEDIVAPSSFETLRKMRGSSG